MSQYYCHACAISTGQYTPLYPGNLTGTSYQCGKFMKHTIPTGTFAGKNSIFNDPTYKTYFNYVVTGTAAGMLEIDDVNRMNLIWYAGYKTGVELINGVYNAPTDGVKIVKFSIPDEIHTYPIKGKPGLIQYCANCGITIPQW